MNKQTTALLCGAILTLGMSQAGYAAGMDTRVERRNDVVDNTADRVDDKQDFRE